MMGYRRATIVSVCLFIIVVGTLARRETALSRHSSAGWATDRSSSNPEQNAAAASRLTKASQRPPAGNLEETKRLFATPLPHTVKFNDVSIAEMIVSINQLLEKASIPRDRLHVTFVAGPGGDRSGEQLRIREYRSLENTSLETLLKELFAKTRLQYELLPGRIEISSIHTIRPDSSPLTPPPPDEDPFGSGK